MYQASASLSLLAITIFWASWCLTLLQGRPLMLMMMSPGTTPDFSAFPPGVTYKHTHTHIHRGKNAYTRKERRIVSRKIKQWAISKQQFADIPKFLFPSCHTHRDKVISFPPTPMERTRLKKLMPDYGQPLTDRAHNTQQSQAKGVHQFTLFFETAWPTLPNGRFRKSLQDNSLPANTSEHKCVVLPLQLHGAILLIVAFTVCR